MNQLTFHHRYTYGVAFDLSGQSNHGVLTSVSSGGGSFDSALQFARPDSAVTVPANPTLDSLVAIRAGIRFHYTPSERRRHNLIEGHLCFALVVEEDDSLAGTIVDANDNWNGVRSEPGVVRRNDWNTADLYHDGTGGCFLTLNGSVVGAIGTVPGPVGSVGPNGVVIGHWPEPDQRYTFAGHISEAFLYKYDLQQELRERHRRKKGEEDETDDPPPPGPHGAPLSPEEERAAAERLDALLSSGLELGDVEKLAKRMLALQAEGLRRQAGDRPEGLQDLRPYVDWANQAITGQTTEPFPGGDPSIEPTPGDVAHGDKLTGLYAEVIGALGLEFDDYVLLARFFGLGEYVPHDIDLARDLFDRVRKS